MHLFLFHSLLLLTASYAAARRLWSHAGDRILATFALAWGNIVVTCLLLSAAHGLGDRPWFLRASLLIAAGTWLAVRYFVSGPAAATEPPAARPSSLLVTALGLSLAPLLYASIRIAATYEPNNYDSLAYHLPRVMFYLGQNTLEHFSTGNDRQIYFPFNFNLLQLFGLTYGSPLQTLNFLNLATWGVAGLAVYRLGRIAGQARNAALIASWFALTSTQILAQATATTNDLPTGAILLTALVFVLRWRESRLHRDALFAGLAAGLTVGSKLTTIFFAPAAGLILAFLGWQFWRRHEPGRFFLGVRSWLWAAAVAAVIASPFALINLAEKGEWINHTYDYTLNRPFGLGSVAQTSKAYLVQLFLEPLHRFCPDPKFSELLNAWGRQMFFPHWNPAYAFSDFLLFPLDLNEDHVWFGLAGPMVVLCALGCLLRFRRHATATVWLALLGLGWFVTYFALNKWSLYNQRYFVLPLLVLSPCLAVLAGAACGTSPWRRLARTLLIISGVGALWLAGAYLFNNSSRPYAPLWRDLRPPPAYPALPPLIGERLAAQSRINFNSTDGNERAFLFMTFGRGQRFTAYAWADVKAYNVFSNWGFVRRVCYSNIEQQSTYTIVKFPSKRTAGVEFLGTIGSGQPALDYHGLVPYPEKVPASEHDRNVMVKLLYAPREPGRYSDLRIRTAGLNIPDNARLVIGVEYADHSTETLATFKASGESRASVTRPFRRFTVQIVDAESGQLLGATDIPYLYRSLPPEIEAPDDPALLFAEELIIPKPETHIIANGLGVPEGPYPQWKLPLIRWATSPVVRLEVPETDQLARLELTLDARLHTRDYGQMDIVLNGEPVQTVTLPGSTNWVETTVQLTPRAGRNVIELRSVSVSDEPDWADYLERYPDVKNYVLSQHVPLEKGARDHWEMYGHKEFRTLHNQRRPDIMPADKQFYYLFRRLRIHGYRNP